MTEKWTQGEWGIARTGKNKFEILTDKRIAIVDTFEDARLIAAAPAMAGVLSWVSKMASHSPSDSQVILMAIKVLSKIQGGSNG